MSDPADHDRSTDDPLPSFEVRQLALEACVAVVTATLFVVSCMLIRVVPRSRLGQISGLASLELRFFLFGAAFVIALVATARWRDGRHFASTSRLVCAAIAGLATGVIGGGIVVALHGTPWGLLTKGGGDVTRLAEWADALNHGQSVPPLYPPIPLHVLATFSRVVDLPADKAIKYLQIAGTALFGPLAYIAWRPLLRPAWALAVGVLATIPLVDPYKPYPNLALVVFVPLAIWFLRGLRDCAGWKRARVAKTGVAFGVAFGILCLSYSGWFEWTAPGLVAAAAVMFPWRTAPRNGFGLLAATLIAFLAVAGTYLAGALFDPDAKLYDNYVYFDVLVEPMYIAMWRNDLPGNFGGVWPPIGELGGVGLFTLVLAAGMAVAVAFKRRSTLVIALILVMLGAWLLRFWYAHSLSATGLVQLYPRTTPLILHCMIILTVCGVCWALERLRADHPLRGTSGTIGGLLGLLFVLASVGSSICDRYMPADDHSVGWFAWNAHQAQLATEHKPNPLHVMQWTRRDSIPLQAAGSASPTGESATPR